MGRAYILLVLSCVLAVLAVSEGTKELRLDPRTEVAPVITTAGVVGAAVLYFLKEASDRRRKTLDAYEKQLYDRDLREAYSTISTALYEGTYESDSAPGSVGSHRDQTSLLINYLEVSCTGVEQRLYERSLFRELMRPLAEMLIEGFLVEPRSGNLPTVRFLVRRAPLTGIAAVFPDLFEAATKKDSSYRPSAQRSTRPAPTGYATLADQASGNPVDGGAGRGNTSETA